MFGHERGGGPFGAFPGDVGARGPPRRLGRFRRGVGKMAKPTGKKLPDGGPPLMWGAWDRGGERGAGSRLGGGLSKTGGGGWRPAPWGLGGAYVIFREGGGAGTTRGKGLGFYKWGKPWPQYPGTAWGNSVTLNLCLGDTTPLSPRYLPVL